ncbi:hypothetical protein XENOCAPTIV_024018, partial [Xenoophorus captivus]
TGKYMVVKHMMIQVGIPTEVQVSIIKRKTIQVNASSTSFQELKTLLITSSAELLLERGGSVATQEDEL